MLMVFTRFVFIYIFAILLIITARLSLDLTGNFDQYHRRRCFLASSFYLFIHLLQKGIALHCECFYSVLLTDRWILCRSLHSVNFYSVFSICNCKWVASERIKSIDEGSFTRYQPK
uniref:Secreted protein n=1 Tax=Parascaris univalens TaxID=6257 RepID=A0A914ZW97_PARUN